MLQRKRVMAILLTLALVFGLCSPGTAMKVQAEEMVAEETVQVEEEITADEEAEMEEEIEKAEETEEPSEEAVEEIAKNEELKLETVDEEENSIILNSISIAENEDGYEVPGTVPMTVSLTMTKPLRSISLQFNKSGDSNRSVYGYFEDYGYNEPWELDDDGNYVISLRLDKTCESGSYILNTVYIINKDGIGKSYSFNDLMSNDKELSSVTFDAVSSADSEEDKVFVTSMQMTEDISEKETFGPGDVVSADFTIQNNTDKAYIVDDDSELQWSNNSSLVQAKCRQRVTIEPGESGVVSFVTEKFKAGVKAGEYTLGSISINGSQGNLYYYYQNDKFYGEFSKYDDDFTEVLVPYILYDDEQLDFTIVNENEDTEAPRITKITKKTNGPIYTNSKVEYEVTYQDNFEVEDITVCAKSKDNDYGYIYFYPISDSFGSSGTTVLKSGYSDFEIGEYGLEWIQIKDVNGNMKTYTEDTYDEQMNEEWVRLNPSACDFTVEYKTDGLKILSAELEGVGDSTAIPGGASFKVKLTVKNDRKEKVTLFPEDCYVVWENESEDEEYAYGNENDPVIVIESGETKSISLPVSINKYALSGKRSIDYIDLGEAYYLIDENIKDEVISKSVRGYDYGNSTGYEAAFMGEISVSLNADYNVSNRDNEERVPLEISTIIIPENKDGYQVPGTVPVRVEFSNLDEKQAKPDQIELHFYNDYNGDDQGHLFVVEISAEQMTDNKDGSYTFEMPLKKYLHGGEYILSEVYVYDEAGNGNGYEENEEDENSGIFGDGKTRVGDVKFKVLSDIEIENSYPALSEIKVLNNTVLTNGIVEFIMKIDSKYGVSDVELEYENEKSGLYLSDMKVEDLGGNTYRCTYKIPRNTKVGTYDLESITIYNEMGTGEWYRYRKGEGFGHRVYENEEDEEGHYVVKVPTTADFSLNVVTELPKPPAPPVIKASSISISGVSTKIAAGKKVALSATVFPGNATNKRIIWSSSNTRVATVSSTGVVTMNKKAAGKSVTITARAADGSGVYRTYKISCPKGVVKKVSISGKKSVKAGKTLKLKAKVTATRGANKKIKWVSSNTKYATVSSSGKVKTSKAAKGKKVKITAMATDGSGKKKTVTIKITK